MLRQERIATTRAQLQRDSRKPSLAAGASACTHPTRERGTRQRMIYTILQKVPGGHGVRVFTGVCLVLGIGCAPVLYKKTRAGHDYFSSEKPEAVERGLEAKQKAKYADLIKRNG